MSKRPLDFDVSEVFYFLWNNWMVHDLHLIILSLIRHNAEAAALHWLHMGNNWGSGSVLPPVQCMLPSRGYVCVLGY